MNIVIDTNVVASAVFFGGKPQRLIELLFERKITAVVSREIADEYQRTINRLLAKYPAKTPHVPLMQIISQMKLIEAGNSIHVCRDSDDDKFLSCADAGSCMYVVSGDNDLLTLKKYKDITILTVAQFFEMYDNSKLL